MSAIDGVIVGLVVSLAIVLGLIAWIVARAEEERFNEVMRTGEREAALARKADTGVALPRSMEPGSGYVSPTSGGRTRLADAPTQRLDRTLGA